MNRRNFIKSSVAVGGLASFSGCIGPIKSRVPFWGNEMGKIYPNSMTNLTPLESHLNSDGRICMEVNKNKLESEFENIYEDPFNNYNSDITPLLHSRSALSLVRPTLEDRLSGHVGESDILNKLNISDEYSEVSDIDRFSIAEDLILFKGDLSKEVIRKIWDAEKVQNQNIHYQYELFSGDGSWVAIGSDWFGFPIVDYDEGDVVTRFNEQAKLMSGDNKSSTTERLHNGVSLGDVNIVEIGTDLQFVEDTFGLGASSILSTATFTENNLETSTSIDFTEEFTKSDIGSVINNISGDFNISVNDSIAIIDVTW